MDLRKWKAIMNYISNSQFYYWSLTWMFQSQNSDEKITDYMNVVYELSIAISDHGSKN